MKPQRKYITAKQFFDAMIIACKENMGTGYVWVNGEKVEHEGDLDEIKYTSGNGNDGEAFTNGAHKIIIGPAVIDDPDMKYVVGVTDAGALYYMAFGHEDEPWNTVEMCRDMNDSVLMFPRVVDVTNSTKKVYLSRNDVYHIDGADVLNDDKDGHAVCVNVNVAELLFQSDKILSAAETLFQYNRAYASGRIELSSGCTVHPCGASMFFDPEPYTMLVTTENRDLELELYSKDESGAIYSVSVTSILERALKDENDYIRL